MAKDSSFDIVSQVDMQEVDNAYQQTARELTQRYDLKSSGATVDLSKADGTVTVTAPADFVARQVVDVLNGRLHKRGVDLKAVQWVAEATDAGDVPASVPGMPVSSTPSAAEPDVALSG